MFRYQTKYVVQKWFSPFSKLLERLVFRFANAFYHLFKALFFVVKEIKSHIWFFSFQYNSSYSLVLVGIVVLLVDFLSSEHAQTQLTQDYTESLNNSCKAADFSSAGPL